MKARIFKRADGSAAIETPSSEYQDFATYQANGGTLTTAQELLDSCPIGEANQGLEYFWANREEIPTRVSVNQLYFDGACAIENLKVDTSWATQLMPPETIRHKERVYLQNALDAQLDSNVPDAISIARTQRDLERLKSKTNLELYQLALANLDSRAEADKPAIRAALGAKIAELQGGS